MYRVDMLPAKHGDALWVTWGDGGGRHHMLIDGGPPSTAATLRAQVERALGEAGGRLHIDLLVISHIDADHIGGVLDLLDPLPAGLSIGDVWFNAYRHLLPPSMLGAVQGEGLSQLLTEKKLPWNRAFDGKAVVVPNDGPLPEMELPGGMVLTLLSPTPDKLKKLAPKWAAELRKAGLEPGTVAEPAHPSLLGKTDTWPPDLAALAKAPFVGDGSPANGSSIAFIARHGERSCLFAADAHADVLVASLKRLDGPVKLDAFKLPHHGSAANLSPDLLAAVDCDRFLISTNGDIFRHPDHAAMARILMRKEGGIPTLIFNHRSETTVDWEKLPDLPDAPPAKILVPTDDADGAAVDL